jgi:hypothetical protein
VITASKESGPLIQLSAACKALAEAKSVDEVADIRDRAEAMRHYMKQAGYCLEAQNDAAELTPSRGVSNGITRNARRPGKDGLCC